MMRGKELTLGWRKNGFSIITGLKAEYMDTNIKDVQDIIVRRGN